jgi:hypothetical protein
MCGAGDELCRISFQRYEGQTRWWRSGGEWGYIDRHNSVLWWQSRGGLVRYHNGTTIGTAAGERVLDATGRMVVNIKPRRNRFGLFVGNWDVISEGSMIGSIHGHATAPLRKSSARWTLNLNRSADTGMRVLLIASLHRLEQQSHEE